MPTPNSSAGDAEPGNGEPPYEWLDEWLCEYVDGAMDPSLEAVFEQYVEANPKLKAHVERLCETRELLANARSSEPPPATPEPAAVPRPPKPEPADNAVVSNRVSPFVTLLSVMAALMVGVLAGTLVEGPSPASAPSDAPPAAVRSSEPPSPAPSSPSLNLLRTSREAGAQLPGRFAPPDSTLPPMYVP